MQNQLRNSIPAGLQAWAETMLGQPLILEALPADASAKQFYRTNASGQRLILMFLPPEKEPLLPFISVAQALAMSQVRVPQMIHHDIHAGYCMMTDFGNTLLSDVITNETFDRYIKQAFEALIQLHRSDFVSELKFDEHAIHTEFMNFQLWFIQKYCHHTLTQKEEQMLEQAYAQLIHSAAEQPVVLLHRDFHAANLMCLDTDKLGIIDFQSAAMGPITYDAVSLLRDARMTWPPEKVNQWALTFKRQCEQTGLMPEVSTEQFMRWFDWTSIQLHLKILGVFARLHLRDHKSTYLQHIPRLLSYLDHVTKRYTIFDGLRQLLSDISTPLLRTAKHESHDLSRG